MKKFLSILTAVLATVCVFALVACGPKESFSFNGSALFHDQTVAATVECNEDKTVTVTTEFGGMLLGKWTGSWTKNSDGTLEISFENKESEVTIPEALKGKGVQSAVLDEESLPFKTTVADGVHTFTLKSYLMVGDWAMPLDFNMTQVVEAA